MNKTFTNYIQSWIIHSLISYVLKVTFHHKRNRKRLLSQEKEYRTTRVRIFENQEILRKALKCLDLMASTQPNTQKTNVGSCAKKIAKICCKTFHNKTYSKFRKFVCNPFFKIVAYDC